MMTRDIYLYAGPSLYESGLSPSQKDGVQWRPPVRRGDIESLCAEVSNPSIIAIADGTFHSYPSVGHEEIRLAIESGWRIYGLCSMGAIRAAEMSHLGMIPYGVVAQKFCNDHEFSDDEVCLLHSNESPYFPMSEPLIHIRAAVAVLESMKLLDSTQASFVIQSLKCRWYGERTMAAVEDAIRVVLELRQLPIAIRDILMDIRPFRLKQADIYTFVSERKWD